MSKWSKTTRDKSHLSIQAELRKRGFCVVDCAGMGNDVPDLLVASPTTVCFVELKESIDSTLYLSQIAWIASYPHNVMIALSADEIVNAMQDDKFLTDKEKMDMTLIAMMQERKSIDDNPRISVSRLRKLMEKCNGTETNI